MATSSFRKEFKIKEKNPKDFVNFMGSDNTSESLKGFKAKVVKLDHTKFTKKSK
ncbi:MAG: hypothetical protein LBV03_08560 [Fusobacteriales bacterium]|jgi:hypothetical protein|nr:hypothetical protein [Fusobacteriales bacterium]